VPALHSTPEGALLVAPSVVIDRSLLRSRVHPIRRPPPTRLDRSFRPAPDCVDCPIANNGPRGGSGSSSTTVFVTATRDKKPIRWAAVGTKLQERSHGRAGCYGSALTPDDNKCTGALVSWHPGTSARLSFLAQREFDDMLSGFLNQNILCFLRSPHRSERAVLTVEVRLTPSEVLRSIHLSQHLSI